MEPIRMFLFVTFIQIFTQHASAQVTLPPGLTLPPGVTLPDGTLPDNYVVVHQALIIRRDHTNFNDFICGGVVVLNYTILTSASCLMKDESSFYSASELSVVVGLSSILMVSMTATPRTVNVKEVITHGRFNRRTGANNLALLKLTDMIMSDDRVFPIFPSSDPIGDAIGGRKRCVVLGWEIDEPTVTTIMPRYRSTCREDWPLETFCTGNSSDSIDTCVTKEGFPIICDGYLQGLVTHSCDDNSIMQYNDISQLYYWIFIKQLEENPYQLIDSELARFFIYGALDFIAWVVGTPKIADQFEVIKFFF